MSGVYAVGDKVRLLVGAYDDGQDHHPPGYLARKGETLVVRKVVEGHTASFGVSHEHRTDCYFWVAAHEIEPV